MDETRIAAEGIYEAETDSVEPTAGEAGLLRLSVIVPARNEERSLQLCLASLIGQNEPGFGLGVQWELLIVDDESTDGTALIAAEAAASSEGVSVIDAPPLDLSDQGGLTGKNNACWAAAQQSRGQWLLFTDADTVHEPGGLSRALREAEKYKVALLSYSPRQLVTGFWQRAVMPLVFSELSSVYPMKQVNDPGRRIAAANGQFLMIEREAYFDVGGHRMAGLQVLEDVALATRIKRRTGKIRFRYGPDALSTRMYRTLPEMIEGWTKGLASLFPSPVYLALWRCLDLLLLVGIPVLALCMPFLLTWQRVALVLIWLRTLWRFYGRVARSHFSATDCSLALLGIPLFAYLLLRSYVHCRITKRVHWKGRSYSTAGQG